jgi:hypothetical protein
MPSGLIGLEAELDFDGLENDLLIALAERFHMILGARRQLDVKRHLGFPSQLTTHSTHPSMS